MLFYISSFERYRVILQMSALTSSSALPHAAVGGPDLDLSTNSSSPPSSVRLAPPPAGPPLGGESQGVPSNGTPPTVNLGEKDGGQENTGFALTPFSNTSALDDSASHCVATTTGHTSVAMATGPSVRSVVMTTGGLSFCPDSDALSAQYSQFLASVRGFEPLVADLHHSIATVAHSVSSLDQGRFPPQPTGGHLGSWSPSW